jgi:integrase
VTVLPTVPDGPAAAPRRQVLFATGTRAADVPGRSPRPVPPLGRAAGLPPGLAGSLSAHSMRHAFASLDADASLRDLQDAVGHASPRTTRRYDRSRGNLDRSPGYLLGGYISRAH